MEPPANNNISFCFLKQFYANSFAFLLPGSPVQLGGCCTGKGHSTILTFFPCFPLSIFFFFFLLSGRFSSDFPLRLCLVHVSIWMYLKHVWAFWGLGFLAPRGIHTLSIFQMGRQTKTPFDLDYPYQTRPSLLSIPEIESDHFLNVFPIRSYWNRKFLCC